MDGFQIYCCIIYIHLMSQSSDSDRGKRKERSKSEQKHETSKLFITNLDGKSDTAEIEQELRRLFEKHGTVDNIVVKRNRNSEYCFAFAELKDRATAMECVKAYDQSSLNGKQIKVEFQDDSKRRKDSNKGCYNCGKMGHFARECHSARNNQSSRGGGGGYRRRSRSRSEESERRKKKRRHRSDSSDRGRSRSPKSKKDKKNRSKDREEKRKKKHKRSNSSDS